MSARGGTYGGFDPCARSRSVERTVGSVERALWSVERALRPVERALRSVERALGSVEHPARAYLLLVLLLD